MDSEQRYYIQNKLPFFASKLAIIVDGSLSIFIYNILVYLNKPEIPIKVFKNFNEAYNWLKEK